MAKNNVAEKQKGKTSRKKILLTIVCIFLAIVLVFGIVFGIILAVKNSRAAVYCDGVRIGEGESRFLVSYYKYSFITRYKDRNAQDTEDFWNSRYDAENTFGELLIKGAEDYIKRVAVSAYLFDSYCELTTLDEINVKKAIAETLDYKAEGDEEKFNSLTEEYGFDFEDFESAAYILYKAQNVMNRIYGENGSNMMSFPAECNEFFKNYSHVKLLFIRTEDKFELDDKGNRVQDKETGNDVLVPLTDAEKAERQALLAQIRAEIKAYDDRTNDVRMTPERFNVLLKNNDEGDPKMRNTGYYFSEDSAFSLEFAEVYPDIVKRSLLMEKDKYSEIEFDGGVCFIYKYANTDGAYTDTSEDGCFSDFFALAAESSFDMALDELLPKVELKDKYYGIDVISTPYNYVFVPRF